MRIQITLLILYFLPQLIIGQQSLSGRFCNSLIGESNKEVEAGCISFHSKSSFSYEYSFFKYKYGSGNYLINQDSLILYFDSIQEQNNKLEILDSSAANNDSITIDIRFVLEDTERTEIIGVNMEPFIFEGDDKQFIKGDFVNFSDNLITFKVEKQNNELYLEVRALGITPTVFRINGERNIKAICYLYYGFYGKIDGEVYHYKIVEMKSNKIILQTYDFEGKDLIQTFIKKN